MRLTTLITMLVLVCGIVRADKIVLDTVDKEVERATAKSLSTNAAYVTLDALIVEAQAANSAGKLQTVLLKFLGRMGAQEKAKKASKDKVKKGPKK